MVDKNKRRFLNQIENEIKIFRKQLSNLSGEEVYNLNGKISLYEIIYKHLVKYFSIYDEQYFPKKNILSYFYKKVESRFNCNLTDDELRKFFIAEIETTKEQHNGN